MMVLLTVLLACHPTPELITASDYNTKLGLAYLNTGDRPRAKKKLLMALSQNPYSLTAHTAMAYFMEKIGDDEAASLYYEKAIKLAPKQGAPLNNYATFLCRRGAYQKADFYFQKAIHNVTYEHIAKALENAGFCALMAKNKPKARDYFIHALQHDPQCMLAKEALVKLH